jgi:hypothetical protein
MVCLLTITHSDNHECGSTGSASLPTLCALATHYISTQYQVTTTLMPSKFRVPRGLSTRASRSLPALRPVVSATTLIIPISPSLVHFSSYPPTSASVFRLENLYALQKIIHSCSHLSLFTLSTAVTDITMEDSFIMSAWFVRVANDLLITITLVFLLRC